MNKIIFFSLFISCFLMNAQSNDSIITTSYLNHINTPKEVAYLHLNKSTYVVGEQIGFTAYVLDKRTQRPTLLSTNLFVSIEDSNKRVVAQKLLKVKNGTSSNVFPIDSSYTSGYYTVKAFTNWMRNFNEQNYFVETIRIIDPEKEEYVVTETIESTIDAQFLPESGHLVSDIENTLSVIIKDKKGYGVPNLEGNIYDQEGALITSFKVNELGIGRFKLLPDIKKDYYAEVNHLNKDFRFKIDQKIEPIGIILSLTEMGNKVYANLKTNLKSQEILKDNTYELYLHNQNGIKMIDVSFRETNNITKAFDLSDLPTGINTFTLFDKNKRPILERLFFNHNGLVDFRSAITGLRQKGDSLDINFSIYKLNPQLPSQISVSILPEATESYSRNNNIISYNLLQPYVQGHVENAGYYFADIDRKKRFELDNLLLSQGWSSYDWTEIFSEKTIKFPVEKGLTIRANVNSKDIADTEAYMFQMTNEENPLLIKPKENENAFIVSNIFLEENESIYIAEVKKSSRLEFPKLYVQSFPSKIPTLNSKYYSLKPKQDFNSYAFLKNNEVNLESIDREQRLDEVVVTAEIERDAARTRAWKLQSGSFGNVNVITNEDRKAFFYLDDYLQTRSGIRVFQDRGEVRFNTNRSISPNSPQNMAIFIDDAYFGTSIPRGLLFMTNIDYVIVNVTGLGTAVGQGFRSTGGVIRIYTSPQDYLLKDSSKKSGQKYDLPLKFAADKKYYVPKYKYYNDPFYKKFGTIDWKPQLTCNDKGNFSLRIKKPDIPITLYIEGIANDGSLVFEEKTISLN